MSIVDSPSTAIPKELKQSQPTTSLVDAFKFRDYNDILGKELGVLSKGTEISEAIVAIPFTHIANPQGTDGFAPTVSRSDMPDVYDLVNNGRSTDSLINFFAIDPGLFDCYRSKPGDWLNSLPTTDQTTITDMVHKIKEFVFPPMMDFVHNASLPPFVSYIFKFTNTLSALDLQDIWQGVLPRIGVAAEMDSKTIEHSLVDPQQFFHGKKLPTDIRWLVFKIKKRSEMNYGKVTQWNTDDAAANFAKPFRQTVRPNGTTVIDYAPSRESVFSYNWPHDFYSLVELGKIKTKVGLEPPPGERPPLRIPCDPEQGKGEGGSGGEGTGQTGGGE